jgi:hypothetical protein
MSSDPPSSGTLDDGWGGADETSDPSSRPGEAGRVPAPLASSPDERGPLRDTVPPPVPVALYVQTMMSQADEDDDNDPSSPSGPASWRGEPPIALPESRKNAPLSPPRVPADLVESLEGGVLSLRSSELPITAEVNVSDLVDLVTMDEMDALAREAASRNESDEQPPSSQNPFPGALVRPPPAEPAPHTLRTPLSDAGAAVGRRGSGAPDVVLGAPMEPEPLVAEGGRAVIDPAQALDPFNFPDVEDAHPFSERPARPLVSEVPSTKPWSSSPPRAAPARAGLPQTIDPRGSIPPILAAWSVAEAPPQPSEHPPATKKGPFGDPSPVPPRPDATAPFPRTAPSAPIRPLPPSIPEPLPPEPARDYIDEIQERLDAGDDLGAMMLAENLLTIEPDNNEASQCVEICRARLVDAYLARLGGRRRIPRLAIDMDEIRYLSLDHVAGFLLSNIDGTMTIEEVLDVSGMAEFEVLRILDDLRDRGVIEVPEPRRRR